LAALFLFKGRGTFVHMIRLPFLMSTLIFLGLSSCGDTAEREKALIAQDIEAQVSTKHPEFKLNRYIRLYYREDEDSVDGVYFSAFFDDLPEHWRVGRSYWPKDDEGIVVEDGGCSVVNIKYKISTKTVVSVYCNGDA
jgi:hypothetical protein